MKKSVLPILGAAALLGGASLAYAQTGTLTQPGPWGYGGSNMPGPQLAQASPYAQPGTQPGMQPLAPHQQPTQQEIREREQQMRQQQPQRQTQQRTTQPQQRSGQAGMTTSTGARVQNPPHATELLNHLSAEGFRPAGAFERVGNAWELPVVRQDGQQVTVAIDPQSRAVRQIR